MSLDLSAALDITEHQTLLSRLHTSFGLVGSAHSWIRSYLHDRSQSVVVGRHKSSPTTVASGVLQVSVLGPLLFLVIFL